MKRFNNWMSYSFDGVEYSNKKNPTSIFSINFNNPLTNKNISYQDALFNNARIMRDMFNEPFDVMLSAGIDSEIVVRTFKTLKIKHNTFIFRLEDNINVRDVTGAVNLCMELNIPYKIIDFNLKKFFNNDALEIYNLTYAPRAARLPRFKWMDYLDNIPVFCDGEPYWKRELEGDYTKKSKWKMYFGEDYYSIGCYANRINRTVISDWYEYTPDITASYSKHQLIQSLLDDKLIGKQSSWSSRYKLHREIWPEVKDRVKLIGYEGATGPATDMPQYLLDFQTNICDNATNMIYTYYLEEFNFLLNCS